VPTDHLSSAFDGGDATDGASGDGVAAAAVVASGQSAPMGIWVSGGGLFWVTGRPMVGLWRSSKSDPRPERVDVAADNVADPFDIATDSSSIYWSDSGQVFKKPIGGGPRQAILSAPATYLAVDGELYFVAGGMVISSRGTLYGEQDPLAGLAARTSTLYWARVATAELVRAPTTRGTVQVLLRMAGRPSGVAVDRTHLYWIADGRRLMRAPVGGGPSTVLYQAAQPFGAGDVAEDETHVYWSERDAGLLRRLVK
jgi:hypothetical protein